MPISRDRHDLIPETATAAAVRRAASGGTVQARDNEPKRREIEADPDAPNAPTCGPKKYITVDPDAPDAPVCKPRRYIVAPDPGTLGSARPSTEARELGRQLSERFGDRA
jgi:hypothetical protein